MWHPWSLSTALEFHPSPHFYRGRPAAPPFLAVRVSGDPSLVEAQKLFESLDSSGCFPFSLGEDVIWQTDPKLGCTDKSVISPALSLFSAVSLSSIGKSAVSHY